VKKLNHQLKIIKFSSFLSTKFAIIPIHDYAKASIAKSLDYEATITKAISITIYTNGKGIEENNVFSNFLNI
jgi:hypothetical protein